MATICVKRGKTRDYGIDDIIVFNMLALNKVLWTLSYTEEV
jgi:hypothetical protein